MTAYLDSGVLVKLYVKERGSAEAARVVKRHSQLPFSALHDLEIRNAIRAQHGRGAITERQMRAALEALDEDIESGRLERYAPDWPGVFALSEELSARHTGKLLCRALDILHVATAVRRGDRLFVTADQRQAALASAAGLRVRKLDPDRSPSAA